jgi:UDP-glucose 4-epimerase
MNTRRDFIYVQDLIDLVVMALNGKGMKGYYHASSGSDYAIKELFDETVEAMKIALEEDVQVRERNPDDAYTILLDPTKTQQDFGWKPRTGLREGIAKAVEYYREYGISQTYTHLKEVEGKK